MSRLNDQSFNIIRKMKIPARSPLRAVCRLAMTLIAGLILPFLHADYVVDTSFPQWPDGWTPAACPAVAIDSEGNAFIFHRGETPILKFSAEGKFLDSFGSGHFDSSHGLRIDADGNIWATDNKNHTIVKFDPKGHVLLTLGIRDVPKEDALHFNRPADIAFGPKGELFIADGYGNSRVVKASKDGTFIKAWGTKGTGIAHFNLPHAIRLDSKGLVYVGDRENDRIQVFTQEGRFVRQFGGFAPFGLFITPDDILFVADGRSDKVIKMTLEGVVIEEWGQSGSGPGEFGMPHGITVDKKGAVYVAEINGQRVQKFIPKK